MNRRSEVFVIVDIDQMLALATINDQRLCRNQRESAHRAVDTTTENFFRTRCKQFAGAFVLALEFLFGGSHCF